MEYNNTGYIMLGLVVEKISGESLADFLTTHFFTPLQMRDTSLASSNQVIHNMAYGYDPTGNNVKSSIPPAFTSMFAAGAIYSTGQDLAKWLTALNTGKVLKPASYAEMTSPSGDGYGYGLWIFRQSGHVDIGHNGKLPGFASQADFFPDTKTAIVVLSNQMNRELISPGENALESDLRYLATDRSAPVRSLGAEQHIDQAMLSRYVGTYSATDPGTVLTVSVALREGRLVLSTKGKPTVTLVPHSDHEFYVKEWEGEVEFHQSTDESWLMDIVSLPIEAKTTMRKTANLPE
jgi:D-alanyl-D-alanine carboxypeptidase